MMDMLARERPIYGTRHWAVWIDGQLLAVT
ncbi:MAG: hypothetical protein RLZZ253_1703, partial [Verrucomicrobiota bacterium]